MKCITNNDMKSELWDQTPRQTKIRTILFEKLYHRTVSWIFAGVNRSLLLISRMYLQSVHRYIHIYINDLLAYGIEEEMLCISSLIKHNWRVKSQIKSHQINKKVICISNIFTIETTLNNQSLSQSQKQILFHC